MSRIIEVLYDDSEVRRGERVATNEVLRASEGVRTANDRAVLLILREAYACDFVKRGVVRVTTIFEVGRLVYEERSYLLRGSRIRLTSDGGSNGGIEDLVEI